MTPALIPNLPPLSQRVRAEVIVLIERLQDSYDHNDDQAERDDAREAAYQRIRLALRKARLADLRELEAQLTREE